MPIPDVVQPQILTIDENLRLRKYNGQCEFALPWYQDKDIVHLVNGNDKSMTMEKVKQMYEYQNHQGELYFIEIKEQEKFVPIGDVTFWQNDMPIVIGNKSYQHRGIGSKVVKALMLRARQLGYDTIYVDEIYDYNLRSRRCFEKAGFRAYARTEHGNKFVLHLV